LRSSYIMDKKEPFKLVINEIVKKKETQDKFEKVDDMINSVQNIIEKGLQEIQEIVIEEEEEEINYCISCQVNASEEQYDMHCEECYSKVLQIEQMIKDDDVVDEEELSDEEKEEPQQEEIKIGSEPNNEIIKKEEDKLTNPNLSVGIFNQIAKGDSDSEYEYETDDDDDKCYKPPINQHNIFFETYEYEIETEDEKFVVEQLNKFMQKFSEKEFKTYSDEKQGKSIEALRNKRMYIVNWLKLHYSQIYYLEYNGNDFFIKTLLKLIKIKMDKFADEFGEEDDNEEDFYVKNLTPQIERLINYYLLEMRNLMDICFPILVEKN